MHRKSSSEWILHLRGEIIAYDKSGALGAWSPIGKFLSPHLQAKCMEIFRVGANLGEVPWLIPPLLYLNPSVL